MHEALTMLPEVQARRLLAGTGATVKFSLLRPPFAALGVGKLRVLRVRESGDAVLEMVAGYDTYERLDTR